MRATAALLVLCIACSPAGNAATLPDGAYILEGKAGADLLPQCSRATPEKGEGAFRPDPADIAAMEVGLAQAIAHRASYPPGGSWPDLTRTDFTKAPLGWKRQYTGVIRGGRKFIYGNYFPDSSHFGPETGDPAHFPMVVCDGGPVFFGAEWDVAAMRFTHLAFNGPG